MKIEPLSLTVRELCDGYADHAKGGHTMHDNHQMLCRACNFKKGVK